MVIKKRDKKEIKVTPSTHKRLMQIKVNDELKTIDDVVLLLVDNYNKYKKNKGVEIE
jgi:hypothetical protein